MNNVGISGPKGTAEDVDPEEWAQGLLVNVTSMMLMAKYAVPAMRAAGGGAIVNIGSVAGLKGGHPSLLYPTSKGAVVNMTRAMAVHHAKDGIRVNCICPGMVYTPMVQANDMTPEKREARRKRSILQVEGSGWDIGAAVTFLCGGNVALDDRGDRAGGCGGDGDRGAAGGCGVKAGEKVFSPDPSSISLGLALAARRHPTHKNRGGSRGDLPPPGLALSAHPPGSCPPPSPPRSAPSR